MLCVIIAKFIWICHPPGVRSYSACSLWRPRYAKPLAFGVQWKWRRWKGTWFQMQNVRPKHTIEAKYDQNWPNFCCFVAETGRSVAVLRELFFSCTPGGRGSKGQVWVRAWSINGDIVVSGSAKWQQKSLQYQPVMNAWIHRPPGSGGLRWRI